MSLVLGLFREQKLWQVHHSERKQKRGLFALWPDWKSRKEELRQL